MPISSYGGFMRILLATLLSLFAVGQLMGAEVIYKDGDVELEGFITYPAKKTKAPAVLLVHAWKGLDQHYKDLTKLYAEEGYVTFAVDIYGKGVRAKDNAEAGKLAGSYRNGDRAVLRRRIKTALEFIKKDPRVDASKIAALGYCFGGGTVLELARSGADVKGVISFHGNLDTPNMSDAKNIKGKVLVLHGAIDPNVPAQQVANFQKEMDDAKVDYQLIAYGGAVHSFTDEGAGNDISKGVAYDAKVAKRAYTAAFSFLEEVLD
jgi:dienelactone hydrolase